MPERITEPTTPSGRRRRIRAGVRRRWLRASKANRWTLVIAVIAALHVPVAAVVLAAGAPMVALYVGAQAFVPGAWAVTLHLFGMRPWIQPEGGEPGGGQGDDAPDGPADPSGGPTGDVDWDRFEREFASHMSEREADRRLVPA